jgi:hypothetical protein
MQKTVDAIRDIASNIREASSRMRDVVRAVHESGAIDQKHLHLLLEKQLHNPTCVRLVVQSRIGLGHPSTQINISDTLDFYIQFICAPCIRNT